MNGTIVAGAVLVLASAGFGAVGYHLLTRELRQVAGAESYGPGAREGATVVLEGRVAASNPLVIEDFVYADRQRHLTGTGSGSSSWKVEERFHQSLHLEVPGIEAPVEVRSDQSFERGREVTTVELRGEDLLRLIGIRRGATVTVVGTVASDRPRAIDASLTYADTRANYLADLRQGFPALYAFAGFMALVGAAIVAKGIWRP